MISSPITLDASNYWDPVHYTVAIADIIEGTFANVLARSPAKNDAISEQLGGGYYHVLASSN